MAIVYLVSFCFLAIPSLFFLVFFLYFSGSIFFGTGIIWDWLNIISQFGRGLISGASKSQVIRSIWARTRNDSVPLYEKCYRVYQVKCFLKNRFMSASMQNIFIPKIALKRFFIAVFVCKRLEVANGWFCCYKNQPYMHNFNKYTIFFKDINERIESSHKILLKLLKPHPIMIFWYYTLKFEA